MESVRVTNTVMLHHIHDTRFKSESLSFHFFLPTRPENNAALYLLPSVLKDGCRKYPSEYSITRRLNQLYGADITHKISKIGNMTEVVLSLDCLDDRYIGENRLFYDAVDLLVDLIYDPYTENGVFSKNYLALEKNLLLHEIDELEHRYEEYSRVLAVQLIEESEEYTHPIYGTKEEISALSAEELMRAYRRLLNSELHIYYTGSKSTNDVLAAIPTTRIKNLWTSYPTLSYPIYAFLNGIKSKIIQSSAGQSHVVLGYVTDAVPDNPLYACTPVFLQLLSDSPISKLFRQVRENTSICYQCNAHIRSSLGLVTIYAGVEPGNEEKVNQLMKQVVEEIATGNISDEELLAAKQAAISMLKAIGDRREAREMWFAHQMLVGGVASIELGCEILNHVTRDELILFAKHMECASEVTIYGKGGEENEC